MANILKNGAGDGDRTRTALSGHRILSPVRMPVSPLLRDRLTGWFCDQLSKANTQTLVAPRAVWKQWDSSIGV